MPLQNRVDPTGKILAVPDRGTMMGNRGGRIHTRDRKLTRRRWASRAWIICVTRFKDRHRTLMQPNSYTELFFLDEATALAAGHRPCFECRRKDALAYAEAWARPLGLAERARANEMDAVLHAERVGTDKQHLTHEAGIGDLPDGVMVSINDAPHLVRGSRLLPWSFAGYGRGIARPSNGVVATLTPASTVRVLSEGYVPTIHESASGAD